MRRFGETFKRFTACLQWAKEGKTFIYVHPDFVAIDNKTWKKIQSELHPPIERQVIYDEFSEWTPETQALLDEIFVKRLAKEKKS